VTKPIKSREAILSALEGFADELERAIFGGGSDADLMRPASDGGWGVVEILPHLADWEEIYLERARRIVDEERPYLPGYDDTLWAIERDYRGQDPRESFARFKQARERTVEFLRELPTDAWQRAGEHGYHGEITLQWMGDHLCEHDQEHLQQARDALAA
jgi:hypothetical protein